MILARMISCRALACSVVLASMLLAGCAGSAGSPSLFLLDSQTRGDQPAVPENAPRLVVKPVTLAKFLDQDGIIYQTEPHRIVIAQDNRWAAPLSSQISDMLYKTLAHDVTRARVEKNQARRKKSYQLQTHIDQFMGHYDGKAHVAGQWRLQNPEGKTIRSHHFATVVALPRDGYPALISSLSRSWGKLSQQIARSVQSELNQHNKAAKQAPQQ